MSTNIKKVKILGVVHDIEDTQARTDIGTIKNNISTLQSTDTSIKKDVSTAQTNISNLQNNMSTAQGDISTMKKNISTIQGNITTNQGNITTLQKDVTTAKSDITSIQKDIADLKYSPISITNLTNNRNIVEMGSTITSVTLNWTTNKTPTTLTLDGASIDKSLKTTTLSNQSIKANKTYTLKAIDERNASSTKTTSIIFYNGVYYGAAASATVDSSFIVKLTKSLQSAKAKTFDCTTGSGQYIWFCIPTRYGTPAFNVGGFDGGFSKVSTLQFKNVSGYTESYDVYRSDNANLGSKTVKVS